MKYGTALSSPDCAALHPGYNYLFNSIDVVWHEAHPAHFRRNALRATNNPPSTIHKLFSIAFKKIVQGFSRLQVKGIAQHF